MTLMSSSGRSARAGCAAVVAAALVACSGTSVVPNSALADGPRTTVLKNATDSTTPGFGDGLSADLGAASGNSGSRYQYCEEPGYSFSSCPLEEPGKRRFSYSKTASANSSVGSASASVSLVSELGTGKYNEGVSAEGVPSMPPYSADTADTSAYLSFDDTIYVNSSTLPKGTPVTITYKIALKPSATSVSCNQNSTGQAGFGVMAAGGSNSPLSIFASCTYGQFVYEIYGQGQPHKGDAATGTWHSKVGSSLVFSGSARASLSVGCGTFKGDPPCLTRYSDTVAAGYKFTVKSITSGATYTTASGDKYQ